MVYAHDGTFDNTEISYTEEKLNIASNNNYIKNLKIYGDAISEISTSGNGVTTWNEDISLFVGLNNPFVGRGGHLWRDYTGGIFYFTRNGGDSAYNSGFRPVIVPIQ